MASAQGCLCILSSQMALHVHDVHREACCEISLAAGSTLKDRASYAIGRSLLPVRDSKGGCVCTYDTRNAAHLSIWPADGVVYSLKVQPPSWPQEAKIVCAGLLADLPLAIYHAESGSELLLVRCGSFDSVAFAGVARLALDLHPGSTGSLSISMPMPHKHVQLQARQDGFAGSLRSQSRAHSTQMCRFERDIAALRACSSDRLLVTQLNILEAKQTNRSTCSRGAYRRQPQ